VPFGTPVVFMQMPAAPEISKTRPGDFDACQPCGSLNVTPNQRERGDVLSVATGVRRAQDRAENRRKFLIKIKVGSQFARLRFVAVVRR
jgi:hypothetical protein